MIFIQVVQHMSATAKNGEGTIAKWEYGAANPPCPPPPPPPWDLPEKGTQWNRKMPKKVGQSWRSSLQPSSMRVPPPRLHTR